MYKIVDKACFQRDMSYEDFKDLTRRTASNKKKSVIKNLILLKIWNMTDIKEVLLQWFINCLEKKFSGGTATPANKSTVKNENI